MFQAPGGGGGGMLERVKKKQEGTGENRLLSSRMQSGYGMRMLQLVTRSAGMADEA